MSNGIYVGIDPSITNTGVVCLDCNGELIDAFNGKDAYKEVKDYKRPDNEILHYKRQAEYLVRCIGWCATGVGGKVIGVAYEDYSFGSVHQGMSLGEYGGILKAELSFIYAEKPLLVAPTRNKRFATGNGAADKQHMISAAKKEFPAICKVKSKITDDMCDAYFLALYSWYKACPDLAVAKHKGHDNLRVRLEMVIGSNNVEV